MPHPSRSDKCAAIACGLFLSAAVVGIAADAFARPYTPNSRPDSDLDDGLIDRLIPAPIRSHVRALIAPPDTPDSPPLAAPPAPPVKHAVTPVHRSPVEPDRAGSRKPVKPPRRPAQPPHDGDGHGRHRKPPEPPAPPSLASILKGILGGDERRQDHADRHGYGRTQTGPKLRVPKAITRALVGRSAESPNMPSWTPTKGEDSAQHPTRSFTSEGHSPTWSPNSPSAPST